MVYLGMGIVHDILTTLTSEKKYSKKQYNPQKVGGYVMKIRCAWHPKYFGFEKEMGEKCLEQAGTTDSICPRCLKRFERELNKRKTTTIDVKHTTDREGK